MGANFVLNWSGRVGAPVINLDGLPFAGNPALPVLRGCGKRPDAAKLKIRIMMRGTALLDTAIRKSMFEGGFFMHMMKRRKGIARIEEIAFRLGDLTAEPLQGLTKPIRKREYGHYLQNLLRGLYLSSKGCG